MEAWFGLVTDSIGSSIIVSDGIDVWGFFFGREALPDEKKIFWFFCGFSLSLAFFCCLWLDLG